MTFAYRGLYRIYRTLNWLRSWAQLRFTRPGLAVLAGLMVAAVMGVDIENNVNYQAFSLLLFLLVVAVLLSGIFRGRFAAERVLPRFGTAGAPLKYTVELTNKSGRTQSGLVLLEMMAHAVPSYPEWYAAQNQNRKYLRSFRFEQRHRSSPFLAVRTSEVSIPPMAPGQETVVSMELMPLRRGVLRFAGLVVARADPLGLFRGFVRLRLPQSVLILPKRYPIPPIAMPGSMKYQEGGVAMASSVGQSEEFVSLRDYRTGDPLRHIHWRSWARVGKPVVKEFEDEFFVRHALVLDTFTDYSHSEVFEEAISVAASFVCTIQTQESLLDLLFVGPESYCFTSGRGLAHGDQMLEVLGSVQACNTKPFNSLEVLVLNHAQVVSGCICVLTAWDAPRQEFVRKLRMLDVPVLVLVVIPADGRRPEAGVMRDQPERFHVLTAGDIERGLAALQ